MLRSLFGFGDRSASDAREVSRLIWKYGSGARDVVEKRAANWKLGLRERRHWKRISRAMDRDPDCQRRPA